MQIAVKFIENDKLTRTGYFKIPGNLWRRNMILGNLWIRDMILDFLSKKLFGVDHRAVPDELVLIVHDYYDDYQYEERGPVYETFIAQTINNQTISIYEAF